MGLGAIFLPLPRKLLAKSSAYTHPTMESADYHIAASQCYLPCLPRQKRRPMVLVGYCMLGAGWVAPRWPWNNGGRHGQEVLLAAHFVSVLCVVLRGHHRPCDRK